MNQPIKYESPANSNIDLQVSTAKAYPRDLVRCRQSLIDLATMDEETAEQCGYCLQKKDRNGNVSNITGPSVRLAEMALSCWGNVHAGARIDRDTGKTLIAVGRCWDLESNICVELESHRSIVDRYGKRFGANNVAVNSAAACSVILRNVIFRVIPQAIVKPAYDAAQALLTEKVKANPKEQLDKMVAKFAELSVSPDMICTFLKIHELHNITQEQILRMRAVFASLINNETTVDAVFYGDPDHIETNAPSLEELAQ